MDEPLKLMGYWNFVEQEDSKQYAGELLIENGSNNLSLIGCITLHHPFDEIKIIHGFTTKGKKVTLYKCHILNRTISAPGIPTMELSASAVFVGQHLKEDELEFKSSLVEINGLNEWVNEIGFQSLNSNEEETALIYKIPEPIEFYKDENVEFVLVFYRTQPLSHKTHKFTINQQVKVLIKHKSKFSFNLFWKYLSAINNFLTLAYFSNPEIKSVTFEKDDKRIDYYRDLKEEKNDKKHERDFLFTYNVLEKNFKFIFQRWWNLHLDIEPVINILQETFSNKNIIPENKFLNVIQGIETFHRRKRKNEKFSKTEHAKKVEEIINSTDEKYIPWLKEKLHFSNEPTLKERLEELLAEIPESLQLHLFKEPKTLIINAKNSRNFYTHYNKDLEKKALKDSNLFFLTERLKILLLILVLKETGLDEDDLKIIIEEGSQFLFNHLLFYK